MVRIIGDTTSCLSESFAAAHAIPIIPQVIIFGEESFLEGVEITHEGFMRRLRAANKPPKTAAPPPELFVEAFARLAPLGEPILCILPSSVVSGTVRSATIGLTMAREQGLGGLDVRIIDTRLIASPVAILIRLALQWAQEGAPLDAIEARILRMSARCRIYFVVDTLKYLAMGGRIGGAAALLGSVLRVKPLLTFTEGQVNTLRKCARTGAQSSGSRRSSSNRPHATTRAISPSYMLTPKQRPGHWPAFSASIWGSRRSPSRTPHLPS